MIRSVSRRGALSGLAAAACLTLTRTGHAAAIPVRLGYVPVTGTAPLFVLDGAGWAREAGLELQAKKFDSGPAAIAAFASGTLDILAIGIAPIAVARAKGLDLRIIATTMTGGSGLVATPALAEAFKSAGGDAAKAFAAFHAKAGRPVKLATLPPGGGPAVSLSYWLNKIARPAAADYTVAQMGIETVQQAVLAGGIDAGTVLEPAVTVVLDRDPRLAVLVDDTQMFPYGQPLGIAASSAFLSQHEDAAVTLIRLIVRANELIRTRPAEATPYVQKVLGGGLMRMDLIEKVLTNPRIDFTIDPRKTIDNTRNALAYQVEIGDFDKAPPIDGLFDGRYYDKAMATSPTK